MLSYPLLVLDAGHLKVKSRLVDKNTQLQLDALLKKTLMELREDVYDRFTVDLKASNIFICNYGESTGFDFSNPDYILENLDLSFICQVCILMHSLEFTKFKIGADLRRLHLNVSGANVLQIKKVYQLLIDNLMQQQPLPQESNLAPVNNTSYTRNAAIANDPLFMETDTDSFETFISNSSESQKVVEVNFGIGVLSVLVSESRDSGDETKIALIEAKDINMVGYLKLLESHFSAVLGSFNIKNCLDEDSKLVCPAQTNSIDEESDLLIFKYTSKTIQAHRHIHTDIILRPLNFYIAQDCVVRLFRFFNTFQSYPTAFQGSEKNEAVSRTRKKRPKHHITSETKIAISAISIVLKERNGVLGTCVLDGLKSSSKSDRDSSSWKGVVDKLAFYNGTLDSSECILKVRNEESVYFEFETFPLGNIQYPGYDSALRLNSASWRIIYNQTYISKVRDYFEQMQEMQVLMDNASRVAQESTFKMKETAGKFFFEIKIETPVIEIRNGNIDASDRLLLYPGSIIASSKVNSTCIKNPILIGFEFGIEVISIKVDSVVRDSTGNDFTLKLLEEVNLSIQYESLRNMKSKSTSIVYVDVSDVNIKLTDHQYKLVVEIVQLMTGANKDLVIQPSSTGTSKKDVSYIEYFLKFKNLNFEAFITPSKFTNPQDYSIAKFAGIDGAARLALETDCPLNFELKFRSLSVIDTRSTKKNVFRDMMIPQKNSKDQFILKYRSKPNYSEYDVCIDRPKWILEIDHLIAIQSFAMSAWYRETDRKVMPISVASNVVTEPENGILKGRVSFVDPEIVIVADPESLVTDAVILISRHFVITHNVVIALSFQNLGMSFCQMDRREKSQYRFLDDCNVLFTLDDRLRPDGLYTYHASLETTMLIFRVSFHDTVLLQNLFNRVAAASSSSPPIEKPALDMVKRKVSQKFHLSIEGMKALLIDDIDNLHMPLFEFGFQRTTYEITDWSSNYQVSLGVSLFANYFNINNSHWEPMIENWQFSIDGRVENLSGKKSIVFLCRKKLEINLTHTLLELIYQLNMSLRHRPSDKPERQESQAPYKIRNESGFPLIIWKSSDKDVELVRLESRCTVDWRFEDWRSLREQTHASQHKLALQFEGPSWESVKGVSVDRNGQETFILRPVMDGILHRFIVEVKIENKIKVVTVKSTKSIENLSSIELEIGLVPPRGNKVKSVSRLKPGQCYHLDITSAYNDTIFVRPFDFGYHWSTQGIYWKNLTGKKREKMYLINCAGIDKNVPLFNFQMNFELKGGDPNYPEAVYKFMAPFVLENLLPCSIRYVIQDKVGHQQISGTTAAGESAVLHTLDPSNLLALNISIPEKDLQQNDSIIITSTDLEYRDDSLVMQDKQGNELTLRIQYSDSVQTGRIVSVYCPYIIINRTDIDLFFSSKSFMTGTRVTAGQVNHNRTVSPILFSFSNYEPLRSRAHVKVKDSDWSPSISFEAVGASYHLSLPSSGEMDTLLGIDIQEGTGKTYLSKIVTFSPRFVLKNCLDEDLTFGKAGSISPTLLKANNTHKLLKLRTDPNQDEYQLCVRLTNMLSSWSSPFSLTEIGAIYLRLGKIGTDQEDLIKVNITLEKATIFVTFTKAERWPFRIDNSSDVNILFSQAGSKNTYTVMAHEQKPFAWDYPSMHDKALILNVNGRERAVELTDIGVLMPFRYPYGTTKRAMSLEILAEGTIIVLKISPFTEIDNNSHDATSEILKQLPESSSELESVFKFRIEGIGISLISKELKEILYISMKSLVLDIENSETDTLYKGQLKWFQIDNQMYGAVSPIFVYPTVIPHNSKDKEEKPVFFASAMHSKDACMII
jgi:vacuolar protein sorting-associated protein 13A/C